MDRYVVDIADLPILYFIGKLFFPIKKLITNLKKTHFHIFQMKILDFHLKMFNSKTDGFKIKENLHYKIGNKPLFVM